MRPAQRVLVVCLFALVVMMLCVPVACGSVRGAAPRRFTFLKRLRIRPGGAIRRIRNIRIARRMVPSPSVAPEFADESQQQQQPHEIVGLQQQQERQQQQEQQQRRQNGGAMNLQQLLRLRGVGIPLGQSQPTPRLAVETHDEFHSTLEELTRRKARRALARISVVGKTLAEGAREHPVVQLLHERVREGSLPGQRRDPYKIGLAIEGGGMRGAVSAGAAAAVNLLGLSDAFDSVYGSSAGALIGAYFMSRQLQGTLIYSEVIPRAGKRFLDRAQLLPAMGLPLGDLGKPVLNLDYLLYDAMSNVVPFDWETFWEKNRVQPLNIVASGLQSMQSLALRSQDGHFDSLDSFLLCLKSSMCVPGVAGPPVRLNVTCAQTLEEREEMLADALVFEPIPLKSAVEDGCTHIVTLRTRPDGSEVLGHKLTGIYERFVARRFLVDQHKCKEAGKHVVRFEHLRQYAADLLLLNEGAHSRDGVRVPYGGEGGRTVHLLPVAPPAGISEVDTLDASKEALVRGLKDGFSAAWDTLAPEGLAEAYPGADIAARLFDEPSDLDGFNAVFAEFVELFAPLLGRSGADTVERELGGEGGGGSGVTPAPTMQGA